MRFTKGSKHKELSKKKMSDSLKGINHPFYGKKRPDFAKKISKIMKGKKKSSEHIEKIRRANIGKKYSKEINAKKASKDNKNSHWIGGSIKWQKKQAKIRDNYTCQLCGLYEPEIIEVDHKIEKAIGGKDILENLMTICPNCHRRKTNLFLREFYKGKTNDQRKWLS